MAIDRISPSDAHEKVKKGSALLICAYDDPRRCSAMHLGGSISLAELQSRADSVDKGEELIFYCA